MPGHVVVTGTGHRTLYIIQSTPTPGYSNTGEIMYSKNEKMKKNLRLLNWSLTLKSN